MASFLSLSWKDCPFLFTRSWLDFHELSTYMWLYSRRSILSSSPCARVCASSSLLWLLQLHDVVWSQRGRCLQVHSSFSESFWLLRVLSCCRILLGIFYEYFYEKCHWILCFDCSAFADGFGWNGHFNNSFFQCMSMEYFPVYLCFLWCLYQCFLVFWLLVFYVLG